jgi:hypothetical protein
VGCYIRSGGNRLATHIVGPLASTSTRDITTAEESKYFMKWAYTNRHDAIDMFAEDSMNGENALPSPKKNPIVQGPCVQGREQLL